MQPPPSTSKGSWFYAGTAALILGSLSHGDFQFVARKGHRFDGIFRFSDPDRDSAVVSGNLVGTLFCGMGACLPQPLRRRQIPPMSDIRQHGQSRPQESRDVPREENVPTHFPASSVSLILFVSGECCWRLKSCVSKSNRSYCVGRANALDRGRGGALTGGGKQRDHEAT